MNFKIGDKVRIVKFPDEDIVGLIGKVTEIARNPMFACDVKLVSDPNWICSMHSHEIEPLIKVGQQLLFSFME